MLLLFGVLVAVSAVPASAKKFENNLVPVTVSIPQSDFFSVSAVSGGADGYPYHPLIQSPYQLSAYANGGDSVVSFDYDWSSGIPSKFYSFQAIGSASNPAYITVSFRVGDGDGKVDVSFNSLGANLCIEGRDRYGKVEKAYLLSIGTPPLLSVDGGEAVPYSNNWSGQVSEYLTLTYVFKGYLGIVSNSPLTPLDGSKYSMQLDIGAHNLVVDNVLMAIDRIEIKVGEISTSVKNIENGVIDINSNLVDMKDQLSKSDSSIWSAGSSAIGDKVGELFTPSAGDLTSATESLKDTMTDKLGGAYDAVDAVTGAGEQMRDKLKNPTPTESITFPGISVPSAGMVEGFTILPSMEVSLPPKLTAVLQPVAGAIVCVLVGMYTLSSLKDMVVCFMSSMSYAEYVHRDKGGGSA